MLQKLLLILLISSVALSACGGGSSGDGYKTLKVENYIAHFSCEYPDYYNDMEGPNIVDKTAHKYTYVNVFAPKKYKQTYYQGPGSTGGEVVFEYIPATIGIKAADANTYPEWPASDRIEESINDWGKWPNFKLLERTAVMVSGIQAELIAYEVDGFIMEPPILYKVEVSFDHNGLQWDISAKGGIDTADMLRADFDHVIETFRILE